jgi:hypothetical protein
MAGRLRTPRRQGAVAGILLMLLGAWGGLIALVGPYFHYAYTPDKPWIYTSGRLWLEILPGVAALAGGLIVLVSSLRPVTILGAGLAAVSGAWFAVGSALAPVWIHGGASRGAPVGGLLARAVEQIGFFTGLGVALVFLAAVVIGRLTVLAAASAKAGSGASASSGSLPALADVPTPRRPVGKTILRRVAPAAKQAKPSTGASQEEDVTPAGVGS